MDPRTWPLSVAATQLLLDLQRGKRPATTDALIAQLTVKELLTRGGLRIDEILRRSKKDQIIVSHQRLDGTVPPTIALMAIKLQRARRQQLQLLMKSTFRANRDLPRRLRAAAEEELVSRGLAEWGTRRVLGIFPQRILEPTTNGTVWQQHARDVIERGEQLAMREESPAAAEVDALGPLLVLVPGGLAMGARTAAAMRRDRGRDPSSTGDSASFPTDPQPSPAAAASVGAASGATMPGSAYAAGAGEGTGGDVFLPLEGLGHALGDFLDDALSSIDTSIDAISDSLDSAVDSISDWLDSAIDSIDSAIGSIDTAIDAGISDGGSFDSGGGDSGGGGDGGGGGGGGD